MAIKRPSTTMLGYVQKAIRAGECLIEIKQRVGHGHWERWVKDNLPYKISKAKMYMGLARLSEANRQRVVDLAIREAQKELVRIHRGENNSQPPRQTPKLQPPYSTLVDACIQLAGAECGAALRAREAGPM
jgi:hypothetical protein